MASDCHFMWIGAFTDKVMAGNGGAVLMQRTAWL